MVFPSKKTSFQLACPAIFLELAFQGIVINLKEFLAGTAANSTPM